ncbi:hypothetical protein [uncultured Microscilla sp.]|nr:hypothetical protein [uncultured Microscilla sp.]
MLDPYQKQDQGLWEEGQEEEGDQRPDEKGHEEGPGQRWGNGRG